MIIELDTSLRFAAQTFIYTIEEPRGEDDEKVKLMFV